MEVMFKDGVGLSAYNNARAVVDAILKEQAVPLDPRDPRIPDEAVSAAAEAVMEKCGRVGDRKRLAEVALDAAYPEIRAKLVREIADAVRRRAEEKVTAPYYINGSLEGRAELRGERDLLLSLAGFIERREGSPRGAE